ncbi:MAG: hypothetical protein IKA54_03760 [Clostridia bacterium]|nr:hypothetical protein [Clostridia bacterium]
MKKTLFCIILAIISIFSFSFVACNPGGEDPGPVANAELDEYNQIVNQMKDVFTQVSNQPASIVSNRLASTGADTLMKANNGYGEKKLNGVTGASLYNSQALLTSSNESIISNMFAIMNADLTKKESNDMDYYAYGIDFSTMTARIAGYAANNYFKVSSFYGLNILMDYGGNTVINASVEKEGNTIKTYLFTTFKNSRNELFKEYNYAEINFTSKTNFNILVIDYVYDEQDSITSQTMIYASSDEDFFLLSGDIDNPKTGIAFFDLGESSPAYVLEGNKTNTISNLYGIMSQEFALSSQDKAKIGGLYNTQDYSISYDKVVQAKTDLGILINTDSEEYVPPIGFVSNKNAEDLIGRKTLQAFVDDGKSVDGTTLTIPDEFNYLSGGIYFQADIDTLVIPSSIKGIVVYDYNWNHSILDDTLCYDYEGGRYKAWGGILTSYVLDNNGEFMDQNRKPFKKFILLDDNGEPTNETDAFVLDDMGNLWLKDSNGNKNYLWGFVSEPLSDTLYLPSPTYEMINNKYVEVEHFYGGNFSTYLQNVGKADDYVDTIKHLVIEGYVVEQDIPEMGIQAGFKLLRNNFLMKYDTPDGTSIGFDWKFDTVTINNVINGARVGIGDMFGGQTKIGKVILNGDFETITYVNGYIITEENQNPSSGGGDKVDIALPDNGPNGPKVIGTYAFSEDYELNGRENAYFSYDSIVYGKKVVEIYDDEHQLPVFPDAETLVIKSSVTELRVDHSLLQIGIYTMPEDRKLTIEFENIAGITLDSFFINDFMGQDSNRVEKIKFNVSETYMQKFLENIAWNNYASWLSEAINSGKYTIEYGTPHPAENEFFENFDFNDGYVRKKETNTATTFEINDEFLSLVKQVTGKELRDLYLGGDYETNVKVILNISKEYVDNGGAIPSVSGVNIVEIASEMKEFDDLTAILDRICPTDKAKLIFNGTKQELTSRTQGLGETYITKLLYAEYYYYEEISFSDNETLYRGFVNSTLTYEDERIKLSITYVDGVQTEYHFEDKLNLSVSYTGENNNANDYDDNDIYWVISVGMYEIEGESFTYGDQTIIIPKYELTIRYAYGENEDYSLIFVYGTDDSEYSVKFGINSLPPTITIS